MNDTLINIVLFFYIIAFFTGVVNLTLNSISLVRIKSILLKKLMRLNISFFIFLLFNFILFFSRLYASLEVINQIVLALFDLSYAVFLYFWISYLNGINTEKQRTAPLIAMAIAGGVYYILWIIVNVFFLDNHQHISNQYGQILAVVAEVVILIVTLECTWYYFSKLKHKFTLIFLLCLFISIYIVWYFVYDLDYIFRFLGPSVWLIYPFDIVILLYFVFNILIIAYHYPKLWSNPRLNKFSDIDSIIDKIDMDRSLTEREREVLKLIILGKTNNQIADELIISVYTVKRHVNNIFKKTGIKSRSDLMSII